MLMQAKGSRCVLKLWRAMAQNGMQSQPQEPRITGIWSEGHIPPAMKLKTLLLDEDARTCNQTVMSGGISRSFVDFTAFSFPFDRVRRVSFTSFLVRNWCGA